MLRTQLLPCVSPIVFVCFWHLLILPILLAEQGVRLNCSPVMILWMRDRRTGADEVVVVVVIIPLLLHWSTSFIKLHESKTLWYTASSNTPSLFLAKFIVSLFSNRSMRSQLAAETTCLFICPMNIWFFFHRIGAHFWQVLSSSDVLAPAWGQKPGQARPKKAQPSRAC